MSIIIDTPDGIARFRLASAYGVAKLDIKGVKFRHTRAAWTALAVAYGQPTPRSAKQKIALLTLAAPDFPVLGLEFMAVKGGAQ